MIDLRSDTVTKPSDAMRAAIASAEVGDDVLGDDPTVVALERRTAELLGKEAALYVPSGTMANQLAVRTHTQAGDELLCEATSHVYLYEGGGAAANSGVTMKLLNGRRGMFTAEDLTAAIRPANEHHPRPRLVWLENTHNCGGGSVWPVDQIAAVTGAASEAGLKTHLDGARLWNASVASGVSERDYASHFDSVSVCFSKGLGAPVGSALAGGAEFIAGARRFRKMFGGGMRQAGIIAAGALYALDNNRSRLADDHANARKLAQAIAQLSGIELDVDAVETNIVIFRVTSMPAADLVAKLRERSVAMFDTAPDAIRAVTSLAVNSTDIDATIEAFCSILSV